MVEPNRESSSLVRLAPSIALPPALLRFTFVASGGPGGQNVNKVATKAQLRVSMTALQEVMGPHAADRLRRLLGPARLSGDDEVLLQCDDSRSQRSNRETCLRRLSELVQQAQRRPRIRRATRPSRASKQRRIDAKQRRGQLKEARRKPSDG